MLLQSKAAAWQHRKFTYQIGFGPRPFVPVWLRGVEIHSTDCYICYFFLPCFSSSFARFVALNTSCLVLFLPCCDHPSFPPVPCWAVLFICLCSCLGPHAFSRHCRDILSGPAWFGEFQDWRLFVFCLIYCFDPCLHYKSCKFATFFCAPSCDWSYHKITPSQGGKRTARLLLRIRKHRHLHPWDLKTKDIFAI